VIATAWATVRGSSSRKGTAESQPSGSGWSRLFRRFRVGEGWFGFCFVDNGFEEVVEAIEVGGHFVELQRQVVVFVHDVGLVELQQRVAHVLGGKVAEQVVKLVEGRQGERRVRRQPKRCVFDPRCVGKTHIPFLIGLGEALNLAPRPTRHKSVFSRLQSDKIPSHQRMATNPRQRVPHHNTG